MRYLSSVCLPLLLILALAPGVAAQRSLYQDYKAQRIGDVITIVLQENISGSSNTDFRNRSNTAGSAQGGISGNLPNFLPVFGANAQVNYQSDDQNRSVQSNLLRGTLSARVEDVAPNGDLLIRGERSTEINGEFHKLTIKGFVRSQDIDVNNNVASFRIANAEITYLKKQDPEHMKNRPGLVKKIAFGVLTLGLGVAAILL